MYHELLMDHYKYPQYKKKLENPTIIKHDLNASCGDKVTFYLIIQDDTIADISFEGSGCIISQASSDIIAGHLIKKNIQEVSLLTSSQLVQMMEIVLGPNRLKCALLALHVVQSAVAEYKAA
ncbi:iron-sulfur cluster assembly scaffold protein [Candidatus Babeliales bacterium]|nr:iron-sulfur cluster assembly scaffold protein [Candidatus Babeliales bacterium]